jgi:hypothetical protein
MDQSPQLLFPRKSVLQFPLQHWLFDEQPAVNNLHAVQNPRVQMLLEQAAAVEQGFPFARFPLTQMRKLHAPLLQSLLFTHTEPFEHFPQSWLHSKPELAFPHFSRPSQNPSPQMSSQIPPKQSPLRQAASVVHREPAARPPLMQKPKLQTPLMQSLLVRQRALFSHNPQSWLHSKPAFEPPHFSSPSQKVSPQLSMQNPAVQLPLRQAASVEHREAAGRSPLMQMPRLQTPLSHAALTEQLLLFPRGRVRQVARLQIPLEQSDPMTQNSGVHSPWKLQWPDAHSTPVTQLLPLSKVPGPQSLEQLATPSPIETSQLPFPQAEVSGQHSQ